MVRNVIILIWGSDSAYVLEVDLLEGVLYGVVGYHLFLEDVSAGFGRLYHLDDFAVSAAFTFLQRGDGFLCHISVVVI